MPEGARRLFPHYEDEALDLRHSRSLILSRLLEDGDGADLAWLTANVPEGEIAEWFGRHGGRQLSSRSRELWRVVLGPRARPRSPGGPLAVALTLKHLESLAPRSQELLARLAPLPWAEDFYLAGSAALALYAGHRPVTDLDLMSNANRLTSPDRRDLLAALLAAAPDGGGRDRPRRLPLHPRRRCRESASSTTPTRSSSRSRILAVSP